MSPLSLVTIQEGPIDLQTRQSPSAAILSPAEGESDELEECWRLVRPRGHWHTHTPDPMEDFERRVRDGIHEAMRGNFRRLATTTRGW